MLPLDNTSGDREQDYFSDGITEDIITELSRFSDLFVIAHNSSLQYKGKAVDVRQVGRELGVHYVLQGSIRRGGDRVRISVQLIDAVTGIHRWAERYERQLEDVFAVQDEVARTIVAILAAHVNKAEIERTLNKPPETWQAYDYYLRATDKHASFFSSYKAAELYEVRRLLEQSIAIDPNYARAYARLSWTHVSAWINPLDGDYLNPAALDRAYQLARKAVQLDPNLPQAHALSGMFSVAGASMRRRLPRSRGRWRSIPTSRIGASARLSFRGRPGAGHRGRRAAYAPGSVLCAFGARLPGARPLYAQTVSASAAPVAGMCFSGAEFARRPLLAGRDLCPAGRYRKGQGRSRRGPADRAQVDD